MKIKSMALHCGVIGAVTRIRRQWMMQRNRGLPGLESTSNEGLLRICMMIVHRSWRHNRAEQSRWPASLVHITLFMGPWNDTTERIDYSNIERMLCSFGALQGCYASDLVRKGVEIFTVRGAKIPCPSFSLLHTAEFLISLLFQLLPWASQVLGSG